MFPVVWEGKAFSPHKKYPSTLLIVEEAGIVLALCHNKNIFDFFKFSSQYKSGIDIRNLSMIFLFV